MKVDLQHLTPVSVLSMRRSLVEKSHRIAKNCPVDQNALLQSTQAVLLPCITGALFQEDWQDDKAPPNSPHS